MAVTCRVVYENENAHELDVTALSLRGAEREMTGWFLAQDYKPVGRWQTEHEDQGEILEASRRFVKTPRVDRRRTLDQQRPPAGKRSQPEEPSYRTEVPVPCLSLTLRGQRHGDKPCTPAGREKPHPPTPARPPAECSAWPSW